MIINNKKLQEFFSQLQSKGLFGWRSGKVERQKIIGEWKSYRKDFIFSPICLVESEKVKGWKK